MEGGIVLNWGYGGCGEGPLYDCSGRNELLVNICCGLELYTIDGVGITVESGYEC